jgi:hypothetical protein
MSVHGSTTIQQLFTIFNADLKTDLQDNGVRLAWHSCLAERAPFCF